MLGWFGALMPKEERFLPGWCEKRSSPGRLPLEKIPRGRQPALTIRHEQSLVCRTLRCRPETPTPEPGSALLEESA
jgi:hypothetical protein